MQRKYYEMIIPDLHDQAIVRIVEVFNQFLFRDWSI